MNQKKLKKTKKHIDPRMERKRKQLQTCWTRRCVILVELMILTLLIAAAYSLHTYGGFQFVDIH